MAEQDAVRQGAGTAARADALVSGVLAASGILWGTLPGVGLTPDSANYLSAAGALAEGRAPVRYDALPFVEWPPLYPAAIALGRLAGLAALDAARMVAVASGFVIAASCAALARRAGIARGWAALIGLVAALGGPAGEVSVYVWSEALHAALMLAALLVALTLPPRGAAPFGGLLAGAAGLVRWVGGLAVWPVAALAAGRAWVEGRRWPVALLVVGVPALLLPAGWASLNLALHGSPTGPRVASVVPFATNVFRAVRSVGGWFIPPGLGIPEEVRVGLGAAVLVGAAVACVRSVRDAIPTAEDAQARPLAGVPTRRLAAALAASLLSFALLHVGALVLLATRVDFDALDDRLLYAAWAPLVVGSAAHVVSRAGARRTRPASALALAVLLLGGAVNGARDLERASGRPGGFASARWQGSALLAAFAEHAGDGAPRYSNFAPAVWLAHGGVVKRTPTRPTPREEMPSPRLLPATDRAADGTAAPAGASSGWLLWFRRDCYDECTPLVTLAKHNRLVEEASVEDGVLYRIESAAPSSPSDGAVPAGSTGSASP